MAAFSARSTEQAPLCGAVSVRGLPILALANSYSEIRDNVEVASRISGAVTLRLDRASTHLRAAIALVVIAALFGRDVDSPSACRGPERAAQPEIAA